MVGNFKQLFILFFQVPPALKSVFPTRPKIPVMISWFILPLLYLKEPVGSNSTTTSHEEELRATAYYFEILAISVVYYLTSAHLI